MVWLWAMLTTALAGDPCPIEVRVYSYTPPWRDAAADLAALQSHRTLLGLQTHERDNTVRIRGVVPGTAAARAGIAAGDHLVRANGVDIHLTADWNRVADQGGPLSLQLTRDGAPVSTTVQAEPVDPLLLSMVQAAEKTACRSVRMGGLSTEQAAAIAAGAFDANRGFRCDSAHTALKGDFQSGDVVVIRGGTRVLLTAPGWKTSCVAVADYDGESLTDARALSLFEGLLTAYVADRHANP